MIALLALGVFVAAFCYDFAIVRHVQAIAQASDVDDMRAASAAFRAAAWSVTIYAIGLVGLLGVLKISMWLTLPEAAGLYAGSLVGTRRSLGTCSPEQRLLASQLTHLL